MTWITDGSGTRWVETPQRKRRASPRALRFATLKIGDQITLTPKAHWYRKVQMFYVVTDMWFDPVAGQENEVAGRMVALQHIGENGLPHGRKGSHTLRGLASEGYVFADKDIMSEWAARANAIQAGSIIGIGKAHEIRRRPKIAGL